MRNPFRRKDAPGTEEKALTGSSEVVSGIQNGWAAFPLLGGGSRERINNIYNVAQNASYGWMYSRSPALRTVVDMIVRNVGELDLRLFEEVSESEWQPKPDHPAAESMRYPNETTTADSLVRGLFKDFLIHDNAYALLVPAAGDQFSLVRIPAHMVEVQGSSLFTVENFRVWPQGAWTSAGSWGGGGTYQDFAPENIMHWHGEHPHDPRVGLSKLDTARDVIAEDAALAQAVLELAQNGLQEPIWASRPLDAPEITAATVKTREEDLANRLKSRNRKPLFMTEGEQLHSFGVSPQDAQMMEVRKWAVERISSLYGVPPGLSLQDRWASEARLQFIEDVLAPLCKDFTSMANQRILVRVYDWTAGRFEFNLDEKRMGDDRLKSLVSVTGRPVLTTNEGRAMVNKPPIDGGDELVTPMNVMVGDKPLPAPGVMPNQDPNKPLQDGSYRQEDGPAALPSGGPSAPRGAPAARNPSPAPSAAPAKALKDFNPEEHRDDHGRWTSGGTGRGGRMLNGAKVPADISRSTPYTSMMSPDEQMKTFGFHVSTGGDAVPGGYNGYIQARDPKTGDEMGMISYNSAGRPYYEATIDMVRTNPDYASKGVATNLFQAARAEYPEYTWTHGMQTEQGAAWVQSLPAELRQAEIPPLKAKSLRAVGWQGQLPAGGRLPQFHPRRSADIERQHRHIDTFQGVVQRHFNRLERSLAGGEPIGKGLERARTKATEADWQRWDREFSEDIDRTLVRVVQAEGDVYAMKLGGGVFDMGRVRNYLKAMAEGAAGAINDTVRSEIGAVGLDEAMGRAAQHVASASASLGARSTIWAREEAARQSPGYETRVKSWIADTDRHAEFEGTTVPIGEDWPAGFAPGGAPGCRCSAVIS